MISGLSLLEVFAHGVPTADNSTVTGRSVLAALTILTISVVTNCTEQSALCKIAALDQDGAVPGSIQLGEHPFDLS
jgi:hypothetical protein